MYALGIDLGTTFTAAAVWRDGRSEVCSLGSRAAAVPSVVLLREDETLLTGEAASRRGWTDPRRVAREFKRRLGDTTPVLLGGAPYSAEALMGRMLTAVVAEVTAREGGAPAAVCISHPANWGPYKTDLLHQAVRNADLDDVRFTTEPEAAAVFYANQERLPDGAIVAVYDLGGGTFDAAVLRRSTNGFQILGQPEGIERLGGIDFDAAVYAHVTRTIGEALDELDEEDPTALAAVARLRQECVEAKEALSADTDTSIPVLLPNLSTEVRLTRAELESMVRPALQDTVDALRRALRSAQVGPDQLHSVLLVGGSSRMPIVAQLVGAELGRPVAVDAHPKHAICQGASWLAAETVGAAQPMPEAPPAEVGPVAPGVAGAVAAAGGVAGAAVAGAALAGTPSPTGHPAPAADAPAPPDAPVPPVTPVAPGTPAPFGPPDAGEAVARTGFPPPDTAATMPAPGPPAPAEGAGTVPGAVPGAAAPLPVAPLPDQDGPTAPVFPSFAPSPDGEGKDRRPGGRWGGAGRRGLIAASAVAVVILGASGATALLRNTSRTAEDTPPTTAATGTATSVDPAAALPADEQCTEQIKANTRWVCLTSATFDGSTFTVHYEAEFGGSSPNVDGGYHLHLYGGDGTDPAEDVAGMQADDPGVWYVEDENPSVRAATSTDYTRAIGDAPKVCARIADSGHRLVPDATGGFHTGNCVPIERTGTATDTKSSAPRTTTPPTRTWQTPTSTETATTDPTWTDTQTPSPTAPTGTSTSSPTDSATW